MLFDTALSPKKKKTRIPTFWILVYKIISKRDYLVPNLYLFILNSWPFSYMKNTAIYNVKILKVKKQVKVVHIGQYYKSEAIHTIT